MYKRPLLLTQCSWLSWCQVNTDPEEKRTSYPHSLFMRERRSWAWTNTVTTCLYLMITRACSDEKLCPILCNTMVYSSPGSSVHGISQARILEWVAISFSRGSSWPRDWTHVSFIGKQILYHLATRETCNGSASFINKGSCKWYSTPETFILPTSHGWG